MGNRLSAIVTKTGDAGTTGMADGSRLKKNHSRVICLGEVDELNANIGVVLSLLADSEIGEILSGIQHDLFDLGAELSMPGHKMITEQHVAAIEQATETLNADLPPLKEFILPGGSPGVAHLHLARTVCRRVERNMVTLAGDEEVNPLTKSYINRLSDLFFIMSRYAARKTDGTEVYWQSQYSRVKAGAS